MSGFTVAFSNGSQHFHHFPRPTSWRLKLCSHWILWIALWAGCAALGYWTFSYGRGKGKR